MGACASKASEERELAAQVLGAAKASNVQAVRRLSALGVAEGEVWVTRQTSDIRKVFKFGPQINKGQFGRIFVVYNAAGEKFACKQISKRKLVGPTSIRDIRREIEIMHHLRGHPNVITFHGAYEDANDVYLVMELCTGGDLFERIANSSTITERSAAALFRDLVETVAYCHTLGVLHRDLKPENFLVTDHSPNARIKLADFGLSCFFAEGQTFKDVVGSAYYMAPEVINRRYGKPCDVWSLGVILHILLSGSPPFTGSSDADILAAVRRQEVDLTSKPWPTVSRHARHLVSKMLEKDPEKRIRIEQVLTHPWLRTDGTAPPRALQGGVRDRIEQFRALNVFKREAKRILASVLPPEEVSGLRLLFDELDTDRDGLLSLEELREGLARKGEELQREEATELLKAADLNCDGFIDYREFVAATYTLSRMQQSDVMLRAFRHFDVDRDGYITREELAFALSHLPLHASATTTTTAAAATTGPAASTTPTSAFPATTGPAAVATASPAVVAQLLAEADLDRDGRVDYREFCAMLLAGAGGPPLEQEPLEEGAAGGGQAAAGQTETTLLQVVQSADLTTIGDEMAPRGTSGTGSGAGGSGAGGRGARGSASVISTDSVARRGEPRLHSPPTRSSTGAGASLTAGTATTISACGVSAPATSLTGMGVLSSSGSNRTLSGNISGVRSFMMERAPGGPAEVRQTASPPGVVGAQDLEPSTPVMQIGSPAAAAAAAAAAARRASASQQYALTAGAVVVPAFNSGPQPGTPGTSRIAAAAVGAGAGAGALTASPGPRFSGSQNALRLASPNMGSSSLATGRGSGSQSSLSLQARASGSQHGYIHPQIQRTVSRASGMVASAAGSPGPPAHGGTGGWSPMNTAAALPSSPSPLARVPSLERAEVVDNEDDEVVMVDVASPPPPPPSILAPRVSQRTIG